MLVQSFTPKISLTERKEDGVFAQLTPASSQSGGQSSGQSSGGLLQRHIPLSLVPHVLLP